MLQIKINRRLHPDDYLLIFACVCLTPATVLGYIYRGDLYWNEVLDYNLGHVATLLMEHVDIEAHIITYQRFYHTYAALSKTSIFAVKFAYLAFFRRLVERIRPLILYWRVVLGITVISFPVCIITIYVPCTKRGLEAGKSSIPVHELFIG